MNIFNSIKLTKPNSNSFDLSHDVKMSLDVGELVPTCCIECVPGDKFSIGCESLIRFAPLVSPVMHRFDVYQHYFFVPNRIIWPNWEKFITNTPLVATGLLPAVPSLPYKEGNWTRLHDYLGLPSIPGGTAVIANRVSALPFAAYQRIFHEYYRDQNLIIEEPINLIDGDNGSTTNKLWTLRNRAWEHDYFTAALPFAQKGAAVTLPLAGFKDVAVAINKPLLAGNFEAFNTYKSVQATTGVGGAELDPDETNTVATNMLYAKTSRLEGTSTTINDLRRAYKLQEWLEKAARGGSRLVENILVHFGVKSSDARLNRPEYITGTRSPVIISEVLNTTGTATVPQGNMAGHGLSVNHHSGSHYFCEEHGYIIGIMSVLPKTAYQQGIPKHFLKTDPFAYYWPSFANIGEQEVINKELYAFPSSDLEANKVFGYVPRYAEYKYQASRVAGDFRLTLDFWHCGRKFANQPALNEAFITCTKDAAARIFAVQGVTHSLYAHVLHKIHARRRMPKYGTPSF